MAGGYGWNRSPAWDPHSTSRSRPSSARPLTEYAKQAAQRIVEFIHHPLLQRNDGVVGDLDFLRAHLSAALGDVAIPDAVRILQIGQPVFGVHGIHFERGVIQQETGADE